MTPKKKRGALQSPIHHTSTTELWQLAEPKFERFYWWNDPPTGQKAKLNKNHPELDGEKDERKRRLTRHAPIVWELLRRHSTIETLREDFSKFLAPRPLHDLFFNENAREVLLRFGFELEHVLIACGLTAWLSSQKFPDPFLHVVTPGNLPIVGNWKRRFEELMEAYRQISIPKNPFLDFWPAYDILAEARSLR